MNHAFYYSVKSHHAISGVIKKSFINQTDVDTPNREQRFKWLFLYIGYVVNVHFDLLYKLTQSKMITGKLCKAQHYSWGVGYKRLAKENIFFVVNEKLQQITLQKT